MFLSKKNVVKTQRKLSEYLPGGTIVKLKNDDKLYMIFRYSGNSCMAYKPKDMLLQKSYLSKSEDAKTVYHVNNGIFTYPRFTDTYFIMHEDIDEVVFMGYTDEFRENNLKDIDKWRDEDEQKRNFTFWKCY